MKNLLESRKAKLFLLLFVVSTSALFSSHATFAEYTEFIKYVFGAYVVGNGVEHHAKKERND